MGGAQGALDATLTTHVALLIDEGQQELLVTERLGPRLRGHRLTAAADGWQLQLLETILQTLEGLSLGHWATAWPTWDDDSLLSDDSRLS